MWIFLVLVGLPPLGSGMSLKALRLPALSKNDSSPEAQSSSTSPTPPVTPTTLSPHSEAPALSLNLGLNFKIQVRSQGKGQLGEGPRGATAAPGLPPARSQPPGSRFWAEALGGSGWLSTGPAEELPSGPGAWAWEGSPVPAEAHLPASSPTPQLPLTLWPRLTTKGLAVPLAGEGSRELEFKIDIDLTAGVGKEGRLAPNNSSHSWHLPQLPGLRVGIAEVAGKHQESPGLFGSRLPPVTWGPPEQNATGSAWETPGDSPLTPEGALEPGVESSSPAASPGSGGAFVALPGCPPARPEDCGSPLPEPAAPPLSSLLALPGLALSVGLEADWGGARAAWGPAWEAHLYGAGALFGLQALLALLGLAASPCRCPAACRLLALLALLLAGAGGARAALLFGQAGGRLALLPAPAARLLHELPLPCLTSALALAALLLRRRPPAKPGSALRRPAWLALPLLLHFAAAAGAGLAAERLPQAPFLLLAARGLFALLAALLSGALLACCGLARGADDPQGSALPACRSPFAEARQWSRAARTALPAALFGLLSAGLHAYALLHALGYGLRPALFGPWPWWALQLAGRLCEAGVGLPLALLALRPLLCAPARPCCPCCGRFSPERVAAKAQALPGSFPWALAQRDKLLLPGDARGQADSLPLCALPAEAGAPSGLSLALDAADPTADFRPPSPIDLRRSIDEALCSEGLFPGGGGGGPGPLSASSSLSLRCARARCPESPLFRTASCLELVAAQPHAARLASPPWRGSSSSSAGSTDASSLALSPSPPGNACLLPGARGGGGLSPPRSPPPPGRQSWALAPASQESLASVGQPRRGAEAALLQEEFLDVCRQIDALSVGSDTIDL